MTKVLIVDDEQSICDTLKQMLECNNFEVATANSGQQAWQLDGKELCLKIRNSADTAAIFVIMLTAMSDEIDIVNGFCCGADDYVTKPFSILELLMRLRAAERRIDMKNADLETMTDNIQLSKSVFLHVPSSRLTDNERTIELRVKERNVLVLLAANKSTLFTRDDLLNKVWGVTCDLETRTVDITINRIREKLRCHFPELLPCLKTVRGGGYMWE